MKNRLTDLSASSARCVLAVLFSVSSLYAVAQYDSWSAPRLLSEYQQMLVNMDATIKALDKNIALAESLKIENQKLEAESADTDAAAKALEAEGQQHNTEVAEFNAQCLDVQINDPAKGDMCNEWSQQLNSRNSDLSSRRKALSRQIEDLNARLIDFNDREKARADEAADLDRRYDEYERNVGLIESRLAAMPESSDISVRCAGYREAETRQRCMQQFWNDEN